MFYSLEITYTNVLYEIVYTIKIIENINIYVRNGSAKKD